MKSVALELILKKSNLDAEGIDQEEWKKFIAELDEKMSDLEAIARGDEKTEVDLIHETKLSTLGKFSAFIAHELNNPLTSILNNSTLLSKRNYSEEKRQEKLNSIIRQSHRMKDIISHFSRISNKNNSEPSNQNLIRVEEPIRLASEFYSSQFKANEVAYSFVDESPDDFMILGNSTNLESVFLNLFTNSLHSFAGKKEGDKKIDIKVSYEEKSDNVVIVYQDNAMGMSEEVRKKIFTPFFTTKSPEDGTGLGMPLISQIIRDHLGKIGCKSYHGKGSLFKIMIPRYNENFEHSKIFDLSELKMGQ